MTVQESNEPVETTIFRPDDYSEKFTITGDLRAPGSGYDDDANYDARDAMQPKFPGIEFDPESACFFAYAKSDAEAQELAAALDAWVSERRS